VLFRSAFKEPLLELKSTIRTCLSSAGANEILSYSFVHGNLLDKVGQDRKLAYQLSNALSPDLQYFRLDLMPSLLDKVSPNLKAGYDEFALFEVGKNHTLLHQADEDGLPKEFDMVALVYTANDKLALPGAAFYKARTFLTRLGDVLGVDLQFSAITDAPDVPIVKPYDLARSAFVTVRGTNQFLGIIGEFRPEVRRALKLPRQTAGFEIGVKELLEANHNLSTYIALPRFPRVEQDICLRVAADMTYEQVYNFVWDKLAEVQPANSLPALGPVDIYQRPDDPEHRQITLRLSLASYERTLTDDEVNKILDHIAERAAEELGASRV
jgi:phenylalanyl-tRNA synthetase beta chain